MGIPKELSKKITKTIIKSDILMEELGECIDNDNLKLLSENKELFDNKIVIDIVTKELNEELNKTLKELIGLYKKITEHKGE